MTRSVASFPRWALATASIALGCADTMAEPGPGAGTMAMQVHEPVVADAPGTRAEAVLQPVQPGGDASAVATFTAVSTGVDLVVNMQGCTATATGYTVVILDGTDCSQASLAGPAWNGAHGEGIPRLGCTGAVSGLGRVYTSRSYARPAKAWTLGTVGEASVLGQAIAIYDPQTQHPLACRPVQVRWRASKRWAREIAAWAWLPAI